jgi:hypothetical protein
MKEITCNSCNSLNPFEAKFCLNCGKELMKDEKPNMQQWLRENKGKTINDYFTRFRSSETSKIIDTNKAHVETTYQQISSKTLHNNSQSLNYQTTVYVKNKSVGLALLLTFFFGPLGLFYSTATGALLMILFNIVAFIVILKVSVPYITDFASLGILGFTSIIWLVSIQWPISVIISMIWAAIAASNSKQVVTNSLHTS